MSHLLEEYICPVPKPKKRRWMLWSGVAASLLLLIAVGIHSGTGDKPFNPYEGSYIVRNGVRIDDLDVIKPQLEVVMESVRYSQNEVERIYRIVNVGFKNNPALVDEFLKAFMADSKDALALNKEGTGASVTMIQNGE